MSSRSYTVAEIRAVKAHRIRCNQCGRVLNWEPAWEYGSVGDSQCMSCGCTSIKIEDRRPIGRGSRFWPEMVAELEAAFEFMPTEEVLAALIPFKTQPLGN